MTTMQEEEEIRLQVEGAMHQLLEVSLEKVEKSASYGVIAIQAGRTLLAMHGCEAPEHGEESGALKTIEAVRGIRAGWHLQAHPKAWQNVPSSGWSSQRRAFMVETSINPGLRAAMRPGLADDRQSRR